ADNEQVNLFAAACRTASKVATAAAFKGLPVPSAAAPAWKMSWPSVRVTRTQVCPSASSVISARSNFRRLLPVLFDIIRLPAKCPESHRSVRCSLDYLQPVAKDHG